VSGLVSGLSVAAAASAALHIRAEFRGPRWHAYAFKPLTTSLLLGIALLASGPAPPAYRALIAAGLAFSLAGDVFLMLPSDRFVPGLASFLVAHVLYIAAFAQVAGFQPSAAALLPFAAASAATLALLWRGLGSLRLPVTLYIVVIATMGWQALTQWLAVGEPWAALALLGAALFTLSDAALALDRFRGTFAAAPLVILGTYYPAQWLIALSVGR
jgi:uncharacterized membrane protein YhhN